MSVLHALLIGIDDYVPGRLPGGAQYPSLHGATRDVDRVESFLRDQAGLAAERTRKLLSRKDEDGAPTEPPERLPTYANLVAAFKRLAAEAEPGDRVYVHYSGHGAQLPTEFPEVKGTKGKDEALVPCDIGEPGSRYLRDLELAVLVRLLVDRGLAVTLVLDCCHSGGAMRTAPPGAVPRKVPGVPLPPDPSAVAARDLLIRAWRSLQKEDVRKRNVSAQSWLPVARYALFAACRPEELAYEYPFDNGEPQGALTYWLLETLKQGGFEQRCDAVQTTLVVGVHGALKNQTPLFVGDGARAFLGAVAAREPGPSSSGPLVLRVEDDGRVLLSWGQAQGARERARLVFNGSVFQVRQVGSAVSWAEPVEDSKPSTIRPGTQVDVLPLQVVVRLLPPPGDQAAAQALQLLRETLWDYRGGLVEIDDEAEAPDLCVAIDARGAFEIRDPDGTAYPNLAPLRTNDRGAAWEVVRRLEHLAKYRGLRTLENPEAPDWLEIGLELCGDDPSDATVVPVPSGGLDLKHDEALILRIVNRSSMRLDFAVLDLAPDYSVTQILPPRSVSLLPLDAGEGHVLRIRGWLPPELQEGTDLLKVFATRGSVSYRGMQLPPLGKRDPSLTMRGGWSPSEFPEEEWITAQVEVRVTR